MGSQVAVVLMGWWVIEVAEVILVTQAVVVHWASQAVEV
jgi:hypothetical protein